MSLYTHYDYEDEIDGPGTRTPMDDLAELHRTLAGAGAGAWCPRCKNWGVLFFGDPDGEHWCLACQIIADIPPGKP